MWIELLQSDQATAKQKSSHLEEGDRSGQGLEGVSKFTPLNRREGSCITTLHKYIHVHHTHTHVEGYEKLGMEIPEWEYQNGEWSTPPHPQPAHVVALELEAQDVDKGVRLTRVAREQGEKERRLFEVALKRL